MSVDVVRGELERLFSLEELTVISQDLLGLDPAVVGGAVSKASFARALTERCVADDALEALVDAILVSRLLADERLADLQRRSALHAEELRPGDTFGPFTISRKLGDGPRAAVVVATRKDAPDGPAVERTLKVFRRDAASGPRALHRKREKGNKK